MRRSVIVAVLVAATMVMTAVSINAAPKRSRKSKSQVFTPVAKVHDLMELNNELYKSLQTNLASDSPDWEAAGHEARLLGEVANVLQYHHPKSDTDWWKFAGAYTAGAKRLIAAAEAKDAKESVSQHAALSSSCKQCHIKYR